MNETKYGEHGPFPGNDVFPWTVITSSPAPKITKVYAIYAGHTYEPGEILGVFSSQEAADKHVKLVRKYGSFTILNVHSFTLDDPSEEFK